jgi:phosphoribosylformimino-5-aminoimidazole carboxamide ribotide isomerase
MRCVFVLDIFNGAVVHAIQGERNRYEPIERHSRIVSNSDPIRILDEIRPNEIYIADLNRLRSMGDNQTIIDDVSLKTTTMADIGISSLYDLQILPERVKPVLGTETASLRLIKESAKSRKVVVSLDMKGQEVLTRDPEMKGSPFGILHHLNDIPIEAVILLDLNRVGTSTGLDSYFLAQFVELSDHPLLLGGGVKDSKDLLELEHLGFKGALVATAVHNGCIPLNLVRE